MRFVPFALPDAAWDRRLADLRFAFSKWDLHVRGRGTVERGALVLSAEEHATVARASEALVALADRAQARLAGDADAARALGVPDGTARLAAAETSVAPRVTRLDFFPVAGGWRVSEFNDDAPGGYNDALGLPALFADAVEKGLEPAGDLPRALVALLAGDAERVGLAYATAYAEDLQVVRLLAELLEGAGVETTLASPAHFAFADGVATLDGARVDRVFRFYPCEWYPLLDNLAAWEAAVAAGFPVVNPFRSALTQSKGAFAWLHANSSGADRALVERLLPRTVPFTPESRALAEREPERWVLKPCFGRMGEGVVVGGAVPREAWRKALAAAAHRNRPVVLQERFHVTHFEAAPGATRTPCIGAYVIDGRFAGYYSRTSPHPVVAYDAANVLTLVEHV